jgi:hypothetical protein
MRSELSPLKIVLDHHAKKILDRKRHQKENICCSGSWYLQFWLFDNLITRGDIENNIGSNTNTGPKCELLVVTYVSEILIKVNSYEWQIKHYRFPSQSAGGYAPEKYS